MDKYIYIHTIDLHLTITVNHRPHPSPVNPLTNPTETLNSTPNTTNTCIRLDHTPSSLPNHPITPTGKRNPISIPLINGPATALSPNASSTPPSPPPPTPPSPAASAASHPPPPV